MDKKNMVAQLAGRMGVSAEKAEEWLQAVMDLLHQPYGDLEAVNAAGNADNNQASQPRADHVVPVLRPLTPAARLAIGDELPLDCFPFRVGRESRGRTRAGILGFRERRNSSARKNNELYVKDEGLTMNVSREHFQIELEPDGRYELVDRGSACGTIVQNRVIGGNNMGGRCPLEYGDTIIVGTRTSDIIFEFSRQGV